ncbi:hypothetical protein LVD15_25050 [Fulvivirga maritima]|uniref:hypothetical protein n=1 Tax=Fulvivirga maritima TaxID=2904247 RepID=UPI001F4793E0|nr:hypothetical protein [Fulvivirga maritima]UII26525.1 hypothetical protein LVD15_25050 [Fulvivirga maritima]
MKLLETHTFKLEIQKDEFVKSLKAQVDEERSELIPDYVGFESVKGNEYVGYVSHDNFKMRRKRRRARMNFNVAEAKGTYEQHGNYLLIKTEIYGFSGKMRLFYLLVLLLDAFFVIVFLTTDLFNRIQWEFKEPFFIIHILGMLIMPYFIMRKSVTTMIYELEREFFYVTKYKSS